MKQTASQIKAKISELEAKKRAKEERYRHKMRFYRGVIHESAASELKHQEVKVLEAYLDGIDREIAELKGKLGEEK